MESEGRAQEPGAGAPPAVDLSQLGELAPVVEAYIGQITREISGAVLRHVDQRLDSQDQATNQRLDEMATRIDAKLESIAQNLGRQIDGAVDKKAAALIEKFAPALKGRLPDLSQGAPKGNGSGGTADSSADHGAAGLGKGIADLISPESAEKALGKLIDGIVGGSPSGVGELEQVTVFLEKAESVKGRLLNVLGQTGPPEKRYFDSITQAFMEGIKVGQKKGGSLRVVERTSVDSSASTATPAQGKAARLFQTN